MHENISAGSAESAGSAGSMGLKSAKYQPIIPAFCTLQLGNGKHGFKFQHPFTMVVAAPTGFGKSYWVNKLLEKQDEMIEPPPQRSIYLYKCW